jgi:predicted esterase
VLQVQLRRNTIALGIAVLTLTGPAAVASPAAHGRRSHHHHHLPDLTIRSGSLAASKGTISGSFFVSNAGKGRANKSQAVVVVQAGKQRPVVQVYAVRSLRPGGREQEAVSEPVPASLPAGTFPIRACANYHHMVKDRSKGNDCRKVGTVTVSSGHPGGGPGSTVPTDPANLAADTPTFFPDGRGQYQNAANTADHSFTSGYYAVVPASYDTSNQTPATLVVWLHGCGGEARYDVSDVSTGVSASRKYIAIAPSGPEGVDNANGALDCWSPDSDVAKVMADIAQAETQFNINRRRVIIAGYSSGGDLGYRTIFYNAKTFAGILAMNTDPFRDTGSSEQQSLAAAAWKFNIVHIAHDNDDTYPVAEVVPHLNDLKAAGYPVDYTSRPGHHYDADTCPPGGPPNPACRGTTYDLQHYLLPHVDADGWLAPAQ